MSDDTGPLGGPADAPPPPRHKVLATDYDGTLASQGLVGPETIGAMERLIASGRRIVLVTGRILADLEHVFPALDLCEWVVAENGGVVYCPRTGEERLLAPPAPDEFVLALRHRNVAPLDVGRVVVATREPYDTDVHEVVRELGLELQIIFNKGAVMVLPPGVNKGTGVAVAVEELGVAAGDVVAVGDAENDHSLLQACGVAVAVANAVPSLMDSADFVTGGRSSAGVRELIEMILADDLASIEAEVKRDAGSPAPARGQTP